MPVCLFYLFEVRRNIGDSNLVPALSMPWKIYAVILCAWYVFSTRPLNIRTQLCLIRFGDHTQPHHIRLRYIQEISQIFSGCCQPHYRGWGRVLNVMCWCFLYRWLNTANWIHQLWNTCVSAVKQATAVVIQRKCGSCLRLAKKWVCV